MRRTLVGIVLLTYCALGAPLARADPTVTPPRLSQDWMDPSSELVLDSDPVKAAEKMGVRMAAVLNRGDVRAATNLVGYPRAGDSLEILRARAAEFSGPTWQEFTQSEAFKHWMPQ